jgi:hypothetical protein
MALYFKRVEENGEKKRAIALYNGSAKFITQSANEFKEYSLGFAEPLYFDDVNFLPYEEALGNYRSFFNKFDLAHEDKIYGVENFKGDIYKNLKGEAIFTRKDWGDDNKFQSNTLIGALILGCDKLLSLGQMGGALKEVYSSRYLPFNQSGALGNRQIKAIYENYGFEIAGTLDGDSAKYFDIYINFSSYASFYKYGAWLFLKLKKEFAPFGAVEVFIAGKRLFYKPTSYFYPEIKADEDIGLSTHEKAIIYAVTLLFDREAFYVIDELIDQKKQMGNKIYPYGYQGEKKIERKIPKVGIPQEAQKKQNKNTFKEVLDNQKYIYGDAHVFNLGEIYHIKGGEIFFHAGVEDDIKKELERHLAKAKEKINELSNKVYEKTLGTRYIDRPSDATLKALTLHAFFKGEYPINIIAYEQKDPSYTTITPNGIGLGKPNKQDQPDEKSKLMQDDYAISANFANGILTLKANRDYFISDKIKFGVKYQRSGVIYEFIGANELKIYHYGANGNAFDFEFTKTETRNNKEYHFRAEFKIKAQGQTKFPVKKDEFRFLNNDVFKNNDRAYILHKKMDDKIHFNDDTHKAKIYLMGAELYTRDYGEKSSYRINYA